MNAANYLYRHQSVLLRGAQLTRKEKQRFSLKTAWYFENLRTKFRSGIWRFSYFKKEGGIREARGTLDMSLIPEDRHPKGDPSDVLAPAGTFSYFDLDKNAWRSFCLDLFIGFVEKVTPDSIRQNGRCSLVQNDQK